MTEPGPVLQTLCSAWATLADVPEEYRDDGTNGKVNDDDLMIASVTLWRMSGRRWRGGGCSETATLRSYQGDWPWHRSWGSCSCWRPTASGEWVSDPTWSDAHYAPLAIRLPREAATVTQILIDGAVFTDWVQSAGGKGVWVSRIDGGTWDMCGDSTEIAYTFGSPPPLDGKQAAVALAIELWRWRIVDPQCRLPQRMQNVTRQGITISVDSMEYLDKGRTGIMQVDLFLRSVNPRSKGRTGRVWSPELEAITARRP